MSTDTSDAAFIKWLAKKLAGENAPDRRCLQELIDVARRLVEIHLGRQEPLRPAAMATKLRMLARNLGRASKAAREIGEQGISQILLASEANNVDSVDPFRMIGELQDWAIWSQRAAATAKLMSFSSRDHKGGRTPDTRLRSLVTILLDRYEFLLGIRAGHTADPATGLGCSTFELFVKKAIGYYAPPEVEFSPDHIDKAIIRALTTRAKTAGLTSRRKLIVNAR